MKKINRRIFKPFMFICLGLMAVMLMSAARPCDPPGKPKNLEIVNVGKDKCTISFSSPKNDGGSPISGYIIEYRYKGGVWQKAFPFPVLAYMVTIPNLIEGHEVEFRVSAVSTQGGQGMPCDPSDFVLIK